MILFYLFSGICMYVIFTVDDDNLHIAVLALILETLFAIYLFNTI